MMALPMNSLYSLTWGDYGTSLVSAIQLLRCHGDLVDCTLAAGGRSFPAHKIVLCAASPFLLDLLKNTPCKHPVVMLAGVNANDLEALLEFVYRGEVSVDHSQLPSLLQAAQCLNIQGLAPQTVTKDDFTTHSIQLQHMIPQHHHDQDQLIATIAAAPQQTVHAQVVEDIHQAGQILQTTAQQTTTGQQTIVTAETPKDVIQQFLPARKRKPRVKKMSPTAPKVTKVEGMDNIITTSTATHTGNVQQTQQQQQHQIHQQQQHIENGNEGGPGLTSTPHIKSEITKVETIVTVDPNMTPITGSGTGADTTTSTAVGGNSTVSGSLLPTTPAPKTGKRSKNTGGSTPGDKPRSRSQSEQPATCPICYAVIRQSRNLRRHLELRHFAKPGVKKEKKCKSDDGDATTTDTIRTTTTSTTSTAATTTTAISTASVNVTDSTGPTNATTNRKTTNVVSKRSAKKPLSTTAATKVPTTTKTSATNLPTTEPMVTHTIDPIAMSTDGGNIVGVGSVDTVNNVDSNIGDVGVIFNTNLATSVPTATISSAGTILTTNTNLNTAGHHAIIMNNGGVLHQMPSMMKQEGGGTVITQTPMGNVIHIVSEEVFGP